MLDPIKLSQSIKPRWAQKPALNMLLSVGIPFNRWLGMKVETVGKDRVEVLSPPRKLRQNHLGGAHACALALLGEFPAGLLIAKNFSFEGYRLIMAELKAQYHKQGRGKLKGVAIAPNQWPEFDVDGELWIDLQTEITNEKKESVATVTTRWQVKPWDKVRNSRA